MDTVEFAGRVAGMTNGIVSTPTLLGPEFHMTVPLRVALIRNKCLLPILLPLSAFHVTEPSPVVSGYVYGLVMVMDMVLPDLVRGP